MDTKQIKTKDLKLFDIPKCKQDFIPKNGGEGGPPLIRFALSFRGEQFMGRVDLGHYIALTDKVREILEILPEVLTPFGTTGLRLLLYAEQRHAKRGDATRIRPYV